MRTNSVLLFGAAVLFVGSCSDPIKAAIQEESGTPATSIVLSQTTVNINAPALGNPVPQQLSVTAEPFNAQVLWESSNPSVAAVDAAGWVTPGGTGSATITARSIDGLVSDTLLVTVTLSYAGWSDASPSPNDIRSYPDPLSNPEIGGTGPVSGNASGVAGYSNDAYPTSKSITLRAATQWDGGKLYYTTDGSTPTTSSTLYSGPLSLSASTTIKAIATKTGEPNSAVMTFVYNIYRVYYFVHSGWQAGVRDYGTQNLKSDDNYVLGYHQGIVDNTSVTTDTITGLTWGMDHASGQYTTGFSTDAIGAGSVSRQSWKDYQTVSTKPNGNYVAYKFELTDQIATNNTPIKVTVGIPGSSARSYYVGTLTAATDDDTTKSAVSTSFMTITQPASTYVSQSGYTSGSQMMDPTNSNGNRKYLVVLAKSKIAKTSPTTEWADCYLNFMRISVKQ